MNCWIGSRTIVICFEFGITLRISGDQSTWFVKMSGSKSVCNRESTDQVRSTYSLMIPNCSSFWRFCLRNGPPNTHLFLFSGRANNFFWAFGIEKVIKLKFRFNRFSDVGDKITGDRIVGDSDVGDRIIMFATFFIMSVIFSVFNQSPISHSFQQHISSPISVTNIDEPINSKAKK